MHLVPLYPAYAPVRSMPSMDHNALSPTAYDELVDLGRRLYDKALIRREDELITDPRGQPIGWLLDTRVPMLHGALFREVGRVLAERLIERDIRQVVGYGFGAHPLVCAVVGADSTPPFRGGLIREERKPHGRRRIVEGAVDPSEPVVLLDDIINSGRSAAEALERLRTANYTVSGLLTLFNFTWSRGRTRIENEGLWVDSLLDLNLRDKATGSSDSA